MILKYGQTVTIGRMKGNISCNDNIYKISSKDLSLLAKESYKKENRKIPLNCKVTVKKEQPISIHITSSDNKIDLYKDLDIFYSLESSIPIEAKNRPLEKETIIKQLEKTASTPYEFKNIEVILDNNIFVPKISTLNELRRNALEQVQNYAIQKIHREMPKSLKESVFEKTKHDIKFKNKKPKIALLLNILNINYDYSNLKNINKIYVPLKYFVNSKYESILKTINNKFNTFIYMPTIMRNNYEKLFCENINTIIGKYKIMGFVISNLGNIELLNDLFGDSLNKFEIISNYTFNITNKHSAQKLEKLGINTFTLSPELEKNSLCNLCELQSIQKELIVYGKIPVLNMNYCPLR